MNMVILTVVTTLVSNNKNQIGIVGGIAINTFINYCSIDVAGLRDQMSYIFIKPVSNLVPYDAFLEEHLPGTFKDT
jgi:hypothetical protein